MPILLVILNTGLRKLVPLRKDNVGKGGQTSEDLTKAYLNELPKNLYEEIVKIYKIDFDLFGYDLPNREQ